jgi:hypothetical protein
MIRLISASAAVLLMCGTAMAQDTVQQPTQQPAGEPMQPPADPSAPQTVPPETPSTTTPVPGGAPTDPNAQAMPAPVPPESSTMTPAPGGVAPDPSAPQGTAANPAVVGGNMTPPPEPKKDYPTCTKQIQDSCRNPGGK